jgi:hypothetical protein
MRRAAPSESAQMHICRQHMQIACQTASWTLKHCHHIVHSLIAASLDQSA